MRHISCRVVGYWSLGEGVCTSGTLRPVCFSISLHPAKQLILTHPCILVFSTHLPTEEVATSFHVEKETMYGIPRVKWFVGWIYARSGITSGNVEFHFFRIFCLISWAKSELVAIGKSRSSLYRAISVSMNFFLRSRDSRNLEDFRFAVFTWWRKFSWGSFSQFINKESLTLNSWSWSLGISLLVLTHILYFVKHADRYWHKNGNIEWDKIECWRGFKISGIDVLINVLIAFGLMNWIFRRRGSSRRTRIIIAQWGRLESSKSIGRWLDS